MIEKFLLIKEYLRRLEELKHSGEVNIRLTFSQGAIRGLKFFKLEEDK